MSEKIQSHAPPNAQVQARLELQWKRTARRLSDTLTNRLRAEFELRFRTQQFRVFDQFVRELEVPTGSLRFQCEPHGLAFLLEPSPRLLFPMLDRLLGGRHTMTVQRRPLTELDRRVTLQLSEAIAEAVTATWTEPRLELVRPLGVECDPLRIRIFSPEEPVIVVTFDVRFEAIQATMRLCLPIAAIHSLPTPADPRELDNVPSDSKSSQDSPANTPHIADESTISQNVLPASISAPIPLECENRASMMGELDLTLPLIPADTSLSPGVILPIDSHEPLFHLTIDGVPVFAATPLDGTQDSEYRIRVERISPRT